MTLDQWINIAAIGLPTFVSFAGVAVAFETTKLQSWRERGILWGVLFIFGAVTSGVVYFQQQHSSAASNALNSINAKKLDKILQSLQELSRPSAPQTPRRSLLRQSLSKRGAWLPSFRQMRSKAHNQRRHNRLRCKPTVA